ncbi:hypothetical protein K438DRAFT_2012620 [Mycena galopus ATCC 62051]|nr:hypothetical protein K438DRAFT_2012620 [Mycena galopus ATCC 62051]
MQAMTKVTLRLEAAVPLEALSAFSLVPYLSVLEIHQARFDASFAPLDLPLPSLSSLLICGFQGVTRVDGIDPAMEKLNVANLLCIISGRLTSLHISGDLISPKFPILGWLKLRDFVITKNPQDRARFPDNGLSPATLKDLKEGQARAAQAGEAA